MSSNRPSLPPPSERRALLQIARDAIAARLLGRTLAPPPGPPAVGVFVTLFSPGHRLRGCVGRMEAITDDLHAEVASCAVAAAFHDPRFPPLDLSELDDLDIEISLLGPEEEVTHADALDPQRYGVVVRYGPRTGVLLPGVEGVTSAEEQVAIALRKGGILPTHRFSLWRFEVAKVKGEGPGAAAHTEGVMP